MLFNSVEYLIFFTSGIYYLLDGCKVQQLEGSEWIDLNSQLYFLWSLGLAFPIFDTSQYNSRLFCWPCHT